MLNSQVSEVSALQKKVANLESHLEKMENRIRAAEGLASKAAKGGKGKKGSGEEKEE